MDNNKQLERKSSAVTLSDMEIFIFPELMFALVLANIMSPRIWAWRNDPWFENIADMKIYQRIHRLKQYIMDHYSFNLDLETWGLTTKEKELARFKDFVSEDTLKQSNALFGYQGDKYYFDIDIRTQFGLDKYQDNWIPYWKTETVEAMDAFKYKPGYQIGAGECVSLTALYAASLFIVAGIPLKDIYLMATPLHSQNYIDIGDGILTNNRRLVTKSMWYNGTALSAQARRSLENERVTIVSHLSDFIHTLYKEASIDRNIYERFTHMLNHYLNTQLTSEIIVNFLRHHRDIQKCFQIKWPLHGVDHYIAAETAFKYEYGSPYQLSNKTRSNLLSQIDSEEFQPSRMIDRVVLNDLEEYVQNNNVDFSNLEHMKQLTARFTSDCYRAETVIEKLAEFCHVKPRLPEIKDKHFLSEVNTLDIELDMSRKEIINGLEAIRNSSITADLAFYAYRDLNRTEPAPFLKAAIERNPVSIEGTKKLTIEEILASLNSIPNQSIYEEQGRLAQPDEVWNYRRGDGIEKALVLANILRSRMPDEQMAMYIQDPDVTLTMGDKVYQFHSQKNISRQTWKV